MNDSPVRAYPDLPTGWEDRTLAEMDGVLFCRWRGLAPTISKADFYPWRLVSGIGFGVGVTIYALRWASDILLTPSTAAGRPLAILVIVILFGLLAASPKLISRIAARYKRGSSAYEESKKVRPSGAPEKALPMIVLLQRDEVTEGMSQGWLWVDGPWLNFVGNRFDFRLHAKNVDLSQMGSKQRSDFTQFASLPLVAPEDAGFRSIVFIRGQVDIEKSKWLELSKEISALRNALTPNDPPLYPPLESPDTPRPPSLTPWHWATMAGCCALGSFLMMWILPTYPGLRIPDVLIQCLMWMLIPLLFAPYNRFKKYRQRKSKKQMRTSVRSPLE